jgi:hypothetical protein
MSNQEESVNLPSVTNDTTSTLTQLTDALGVPRDVLASDEDIDHVWGELPRVLQKIPYDKRNELHAKMCVAVSTGLFDGAINYAWNSAVVELRSKVREFGLHIVPELIDRQFDEEELLDLKDAELLDLCLKLNLISEEGYFFLDQCRDVRNNFSAAHPPIGALDDYEFLQFINRCAKYALSNNRNPQGVNPSAFIGALKADRFTEGQKDEWKQRLEQTHDAQRSLLIGTLHGIYCDPSSTEETRLNALDICEHFADELSPSARSNLVNRHSNYIAEGKADRKSASQAFFENLGLVELLTDPERHSIISSACDKLMSAHRGYDNFHTEPPYAEKLRELTEQAAVPETTQVEFVETVATCATGNQYGVSHKAFPDYKDMVQNFSPREISLLLEMPQRKTLLSERLDEYKSCRDRFSRVVEMIDPASVPTGSESEYQKWAT